jgi:Flp pilus assembly protein TadB
MRQTKPNAGDRAPFLFMGVLCWLCGAVVVGVATQLVFGWVEALVAVAVLTAIVLAVFWSLSSSAPSGGTGATRK